MMKRILLITFLFISYFSFAQRYRQEFQLKMPYDGKSVYEQKVLTSEYFVLPNTLQLYPGEKLFIETEVAGDKFTSMRVVDSVEFPEKTITIDLQQVVKDGKHQSIMLKVTNPFKKDLDYKASIFIFEQGKWVDTSILPVKAGLVGYETWPDFIISMVLKDFKLK